MVEAINQFGAMIGVGGLLVVGFVYLYSTAKRGRQDIIRQDNADLRASNQEMPTSAGRCRTCRRWTGRRRRFPCIVWHQIRGELLGLFSPAETPSG